MDSLLNRILANWKTTATGILSVASICVGAFVASGSTGKDFVIAGTIIAGLTGLLAKDA